MDEAHKLGELLKLPNLEEDTIKLINEKMRLMIGEINPLSSTQKDEIHNIMSEWVDGKMEGEN